MEQPKGLHRREGGSFLWFVQAKGEREIVTWDVLCGVLEKTTRA